MCAASNEREVFWSLLPPVSPWEKLARATVRSDRQWSSCCLCRLCQICFVALELINILSFIKWECFASIRLASRTNMWCLVSQPNSVILEVEVDPKARGEECLEKVCRFLLDNFVWFVVCVNVFQAILAKRTLRLCQCFIIKYSLRYATALE